MIPNNPRGIIELGNLSIKCLIFQINDNGLKILSTSITQSEGIHNGVIVNMSKAADALRSCITNAEKKADVSLKSINVVFEQPEFLCTKFSKHRKINGSKIHKDDIEFLLKEAKKQVTLNDDKQSIIHIFNHNYIVDGKAFIEEPINVYADSLSHEMTFITTPKNNLKNIYQTFVDCDIEVERFISCTFALAVKLLNNNELQFGSILIDLGFEKTGIGLFKNLALVHSFTFPVGIHHIMKDISKVCSLTPEESEIITKKIDFSFQEEESLFNSNGYLKDIYFKNSSFRKISKSLILNIAKARLNEIFEMIQKQIVRTELNPATGTNFFITGGGSRLCNIENYCSNFFKTEVKKPGKNGKSNEKFQDEDSFASCLGALKIIIDGWETEAIPRAVYKHDKKTSFLAKIFGNLT